MLWTNQVLPLLVQRDSLNTSRSKDRTVSLFFLPKPLHSPHPLSSYIALPSSRSLFKTNMVKVCARSRQSNGKIGDCEQSKYRAAGQRASPADRAGPRPWAELGPVSRKSRNFPGHFWVSQLPLYLKKGADLSRQTSMSFCFLLP